MTVFDKLLDYFCGDVVSDSVNMALGNEDRILDQIYGLQICSDFHYDDLIRS